MTKEQEFRKQTEEAKFEAFSLMCKKVAELEQRLEQTEKDLLDYQFNYPTIKELQKENAELTCQMKRNTYCYSCTNATEKCYKKEIGCPCGDYKFYKDEITELRKLKRVEEETEAAETSNDCTNCKYYSEMPSGKHCQGCDNGSKFKEA